MQSSDQLTASHTQGFDGFAPYNVALKYDGAGNRIQDSRLGGINQIQANQLYQDAKYNYIPDASGLGQIGSIANQQTAYTTNMGYEPDGKLIAAQIDPAGSGQPPTEIDYYYDALGRRVAKQVNSLSWQQGQQGLQSTPTLQFGQVFVHLMDEDRILIGQAGDATQTLYIDGEGIDEHLGQVNAKDAKGYATDHLGSVLNTDVAGDAQGYGAFGESRASKVVQLTKTSDPAMYGYTGRSYDPESRLYYYRARMYAPSIGRFMSPDPILFAGGSTNLYSYVVDDPVNFADPTGLSRVTFDPTRGTISIYPGNSSTVQGPPEVFPAGNNTTNPGGVPLTPGSNGPAPVGTFPVGGFVPKGGGPNGSFGSGFYPIFLPTGPNGQRTGVGIHAGRANSGGPSHMTNGCIRTTEGGLGALGQDPPTTITILDR